MSKNLTFEPAPSSILFVVVVADHRQDGPIIESASSPHGQFASFIGEDLDALVEHAQETVRGWSFANGGPNTSRVDGKPYRLLVGQLTGVVKKFSDYEVVAL